MENGTYTDIEANSTFYISGMGNVTITGTIGEGAVISKSGTGDLFVNGTVGENVKFKISGMGNIKFAKKPPQSVINGFEKSGMGDITIPGGYSIQSQPQKKTKNTRYNYNNSNIDSDNDVVFNHSFGEDSMDYVDSNSIVNIGNVGREGISIVSNDGLVKITKNRVTTTYAGKNASFNNNQLYIDGSRVTESDNRILHVEQASNSRTTFHSTHSFIKSTLPVTNISRSPQVTVEEKPNSNLNDYSPATKAYLDSFKDKKKNSDILKGLKLSEEEEKLLEDYCDPITSDVMNIPVILNERTYDLEILLEIQKKDKLDPFNKYEFTFRDIQPARKTTEELQKIVQQIKEFHKNKQSKEQASLINEPEQIFKPKGFGYK